MVEHIWTVACNKTVIDKDSNNMSIIDTLEEIQVGVKVKKENEEKDAVIRIPLEYEIVSYWFRTEKDVKDKVEMAIEVVDPKGKQLDTFTHSFAFPQGKDRVRTRVRIKGFGVTVPGYYKFVLKLKKEDGDKKVAELPVEVKLDVKTER